MTESATLIRRSLIHDEMSEQQVLSSWGDAQKSKLCGVLFAPGSSTEFPNVDLQVLSTLATIYVPSGSDVKAGDRIEARGALWDVVGHPSEWGLGMAVSLKRIRG